MATLYHLSQRYLEVRDAVFDSADDDGMINPNMLDLLEQADDAIETKIEACARIARELEHQSAVYKVEAQRMSRRSEAFSNHLKRLKEYMIEQMDLVGKTKVECVPAVRIQRNSQSSIEIVDLEKVPAKFDVIYPRDVSKSLIAEALKAKEDVPGISVHTGRHLRIA